MAATSADSSSTAPARAGSVAPLPVRRLTRSRRILFAISTALLSYALLELICWGLLVGKFGRVELVRQQLHSQAETTAITGLGRHTEREDREAIPTEVVHPYLGFVRRPPSTETPELQYGLATTTPIQHRASGQVLVAIVGGSVAEFFAAEAGEELRRRLVLLPEFAGKKVVLIPLGLSSYKQPQQLMLINYLLSLGAEFDYLINLDGYNELVLPATFNAPHQVFPSYPREWNLRVTRAADIETLRLIGRIAYLREGSQRWAELFDRAPYRWSPLALLVWQGVHSAVQRAATTQYAAYRERQIQKLDFAGTGPLQTFRNEQELHEHCVEVWFQSSLQLQQIAQGRGIKYFHFLQPNQYVPQSKPMGDIERSATVDQSHESRPHVVAGYPLLQAAGQRLKQQHVRFYDLTLVFSKTESQIYRDTCCHVNTDGNKLLAQAIAQAIGEGD